MKTHHLGEDVVLLSRQIFFHIGDGPLGSGAVIKTGKKGPVPMGLTEFGGELGFSPPKTLVFQPEDVGFKMIQFEKKTL